MTNKIKDFFYLIRIHQYVKNLFIFFPLFFVGQILDSALFMKALIAFLAFSISASGIYVLNDYKDIEDDKIHPKKKYRPLASGTISKNSGILIMLICFVIGITSMISLSTSGLLFLILYIVSNFFYSFYLKRIGIIDVVIVATGFVLRILVGSAVTDVHLSMWIIIMTFLLALFIALAKRRDDVIVFINSGKKMRKSIDQYNLQFIDNSMMVISSVIIVSYILYTTSPLIISQMGNNHLYISTIFVLIGLMRYSQLAYVYNDTSSPTTLLYKDKFLQLTVFCWLSFFVWIIY